MRRGCNSLTTTGTMREPSKASFTSSPSPPACETRTEGHGAGMGTHCRRGADDRSAFGVPEKRRRTAEDHGEGDRPSASGEQPRAFSLSQSGSHSVPCAEGKGRHPTAAAGAPHGTRTRSCSASVPQHRWFPHAGGSWNLGAITTRRQPEQCDGAAILRAQRGPCESRLRPRLHLCHLLPRARRGLRAAARGRALVGGAELPTKQTSACPRDAAGPRGTREKETGLPRAERSSSPVTSTTELSRRRQPRPPPPCRPLLRPARCRHPPPASPQSALCSRPATGGPLWHLI